jgi:hypothetical protein
MASKAEITQGWGAWPSKTELLHSCVGLGSLASTAEIMQGWGVQPSETEGCTVLEGVWPGGDHKCLWIPGLQGLSHGDHAGLRGGSLG